MIKLLILLSVSFKIILNELNNLIISYKTIENN